MGAQCVDASNFALGPAKSAAVGLQTPLALLATVLAVVLTVLQ
jgi:hypothetical protein